MATSILIAHYLTPGSSGPAFVCDDKGCARAFTSVDEAAKHIRAFKLNERAGIWTIHVLSEIADGEIIEYNSSEFGGIGSETVFVNASP